MVEQAAKAIKKVVCVGGGHCNCQVLKLLKEMSAAQNLAIKLTLVNEAPKSYYSGMLPGSVSSKSK